MMIGYKLINKNMRKIKNWFKNLERINGMLVIRNKVIPFPGYKAINLFGVLFVRGNASIDDITLNHEKIHTAQIKEMLYVFFYVWYVIEWLIRLPFGNAYRNISFEREAYANDDNLTYLETRRRFAFVKYMKI